MAKQTPNGLSILVVQSGFVFLAKTVFDGERDGYACTEASVIRNWGTTRGLGEIALTGPTPNTVLDPCGTMFVPNHAVLCVITCVY